MLCQAVQWQNAVNVTVQGHSINKSGGTESWSDAGASSLSTMGTTISAGQDGYVTARADRTDQHWMVGLSKGDSSQSYTDIDYAIEMAAGGVLKIHEGGTSRGTFGTYSVGDTLHVAVEGGAVKYYRNSTLLYTSTVSPSYPLGVDTSLYTPGMWLRDVYLCRQTQVNVTRTLYIGALYEEVTGSSTSPHIVYYSFSGKPLAIRRVNQLAQNGQLRTAIDHLGSRTLLIDTSTPPQEILLTKAVWGL